MSPARVGQGDAITGGETAEDLDDVAAAAAESRNDLTESPQPPTKDARTGGGVEHGSLRQEQRRRNALDLDVTAEAHARSHSRAVDPFERDLGSNHFERLDGVGRCTDEAIAVTVPWSS